MRKFCRPFFVTLTATIGLNINALGSEVFEGTITATETYNGAATQLLYTCGHSQLRIENPDKSKPEPVNIDDLAANRLTIIYPHNQSYVVIDLAKNATAGNGPPMPSVIATPPSVAGPRISPPQPQGFPSPPPLPSIPAMPPNPMAAMPMMPPIPAMTAALELKKTKQTKKIQGYDCILYTITNRVETMEVWATSDAELFSFYLRQSSFSRQNFGPAMLEVVWTDALQKQKLFPLEAVVRLDPMARARYTFRWTRSTNTKSKIAPCFMLRMATSKRVRLICKSKLPLRDEQTISLGSNRKQTYGEARR